MPSVRTFILRRLKTYRCIWKDENIWNFNESKLKASTTAEKAFEFSRIGAPCISLKLTIETTIRRKSRLNRRYGNALWPIDALLARSFPLSNLRFIRLLKIDRSRTSREWKREARDEKKEFSSVRTSSLRDEGTRRIVKGYDFPGRVVV